MRKNIRSNGFTIVELLVVIIVISILASIVIVVYNNAQGRARDATRKADVLNIAKALELYYDDNGSYPAASGTNSSVNASWYSSDTTSWSAFASVLSGTINSLPADPTNKAGNVTSASNYGINYAYYGNTSTYCGATAGQMYIIEYRLEHLPKEKYIDGVCNTNGTLWNTHHTNGVSYYMVVKNGT